MTTGYIYQGDPRVIMDADGSDMPFVGGQPIMDQGLENAALMSGLTDADWPGNAILTNPAQKFTSKVETVAQQALTLSNLNSLSAAWRAALQWMIDTNIAASIDATTVNPVGSQRETTIVITPPSGETEIVLLTQAGLNWIAQQQNPASGRLP
jgi:phage gp46-like protein